MKEDNPVTENKSEEYKTELRFPKAYRYAMLICALGILVLTAIATPFSTEPELWWTLAMTSIPAFMFFYCYTMWKVDVGKDGLKYRNMLGITKYYRYSELTYAYNKTVTKLYFYKNKKKVFSIPYFVEGDRSLLRAYKKSVNKNNQEPFDEM